MKCIHCLRDSKKSERIGGICPGCQKPFAFEPTVGQPTDAAFKAALDRVSGQGKVRFTAENVYFEMERHFGRKPGENPYYLAGCLMIPIASVGGMLALVIGAWALLLSVVAVILMPMYLIARKGKTVQLSEVTFDTWLGLWKGTHGLPAGLIEPRAALPSVESVAAMRSELEHYSFDRAVICDRRETVDLLLANNFHFENNCAVLSIDGYPASVFDLVRQMLKRNPKLHIFTLHDATLEGCAMAHNLATDPSWFVGQGPIFDIGLRPAHAEAFKGQWQEAFPQDRAASCPPGVTQEEYAWLRRYRLSLAAVRPEQVIKRLFRAISERKADSVALSKPDESTRVSHVDVVIFSTDASTSDGGGDNFG